MCFFIVPTHLIISILKSSPDHSSEVLSPSLAPQLQRLAHEERARSKLSQVCVHSAHVGVDTQPRVERVRGTREEQHEAEVLKSLWFSMCAD